jgi:hypothetical protein
MWERRVSVGPAFEVSAVGLKVRGEVSLEEWEEAGRQLVKLNGSVMWWVGDWACYGAGRFGEKYDAVIAATGYEYQSIANAKWVASRVKFSRRRENLSFGHHAEVASLSAGAQRDWLKRAEQEGWSVRDLRSQLGERRVTGREEDATDEWWTPPAIIERASAVMEGVDLDPCAGGEGAPAAAERRIEVGDDGLAQRWHGRVFMNPPYGAEVERWIDHLLEEYEAGRVTDAVVLLAARTDTAWFRKLRKFPRCFIAGRVRFGGAAAAAPFPSVVIYLGKDVRRFAKTFGDLGDVYEWVPAAETV